MTMQQFGLCCSILDTGLNKIVAIYILTVISQLMVLCLPLMRFFIQQAGCFADIKCIFIVLHLCVLPFGA